MIIQKFEEQVETFAEKPAVVTENKQLTYRELNYCANGVAFAIRNRNTTSPGKKTDRVVGLLFEHGADMIIGVLGTLKADKIYVPLDITYPENRLAYMLADSQVYLVLTNTKNLSLSETLVEKTGNDVQIVNIDTMCNATNYPDIERTPCADKLAYILYTSGSTGKPKGILQNHENVCYYIRNWSERFSLSPMDRMTLFSAFSHDGAGQDMFGALHNGATLYPYNILNRANIAELSQWLIDEKITIWHSVPTLYRYFVDTLAAQEIVSRHFPDLRFILLGGEQVRKYDIEMFKRFFLNAKFANVYGQTESSVNSIWCISAGDPVNKMLVGDPLDKTKMLIVDEEGTVVEDIGVGEIVVSCPHIAPGYWQDEQSSGRVFFSDPEMGLLYRTGDLGRLLTDGNIEFLGRKDSQVKIRGFRIEVGEVETTLLNHDALKEVTVIARNDDQGNAHLYAYYVPDPSISKPGAEVTLTVSDLRKYLSYELPEHMIPSYFVELEHMPLTPNGKVDQKMLPEPEHTRPQLAVTYVAPETRIEKQISDIWRETLQVDKVGINDNFFDLGGTSFDILRITAKLYEMYKQDIPVISFFQYPTIGSFVEYLNRDREVTGVKVSLGKEVAGIGSLEKPSEIAVIGMSGRFPDSKDLDEFWENLKNGVESILFFSDQELINEPVAEPRPLDNPRYIKARGTIGDIAFFDAGFFNFTPGEAEIMDPQLRIMHELSWQALETAGYDPGVYDGLIGIYAGNAATHSWTTLTWMNQKSLVDLGFLNNNYSTIVSYKLNLKGPSFILKTACSTSLVAIHLACQGLKNHECDMALAGGVSIWLPNKDGYMYQEGMIYSRDGHCRTFDARASGTVFGNGAGIVLLKPLESAIADGDPVLAIIKGSGINNDGSRKIGLASPSIEGQSEIIRKVYSDSGIDPESISYVETHGTGTVMGDPVELEALRLAFNTSKKQYCCIGSVKTNIGHLNIASGVAGFIKTVLSLKHRMLPPNLHFETPNPRFDFENSPFYVVTKLTKWKPGPLRAGVSSFGIGGTNAHIILEEAPQIAPSSESHSLNMLLLSARSKTTLQKITENLADYLKENPHVNLTDAAYTLQVGRKSCKQRRMILCSRIDEAIDLLMSAENASTPETGKIQAAVFEEGDRPVVFMFPGQGAQYTDMGLELYQTQPQFREEMNHCFEILKPLLDYDMKEILYPENQVNKQNADRINQTEITQPVLFILEYALARLLIKWGVKPSAMIGHSIGEYVAACLSGVFSLEDALKVVVLRGKLMQQMPAGSMLSVPMPEEEIKPLLLEANAAAAAPDELSLAAVNTTSYCVVSGSHNAIDAFEGRLRKRGSECKRLHTSHAFHSVMMEAMLQEFREKLKDISFSKPVIPYISNLMGRWITVEEAVDPGYWTRHVRETVRFSDGLTELLKDANTVFLEVGPGRSLATFVRQHKNKKPAQMNLNLVRHPKENISDSYYLLGRIGRLWLIGGKIDWQQFYAGEKRHRVSLPIYPFERKRYWLEGDFNGLTRLGSAAEPQLKKKINPADWFYMQIWNSRTSTSSVFNVPHTAKTTETFNWLVFIDECDIGTRLAGELSGQGHYVMIVRTGTGLVKTGDNEFTINPSQADDYKALLREYLVRGKIPTRILHLWNITADDDEQDYQWLQELGYYSLIYLAQAIGEQNWKENLDISVLTNRLLAVNGRERLVPSKASILGAVQVIPREYANINCRCIDIEIPGAGPPQAENIIPCLVDELLSETTDTLIAFRDNYRWVRSFAPVPLAEPEAEAPRLKRKGVYLVAGGLGGIGLVLAEYLVKSVSARLVLTGRTPLPDRKKWQQWLDSHPPQEAIGNKIRKVLHLEEAGAEVLVGSADVTDKAQMQRVVNRARERFGKIDGVIHSAGVPGGGLIQRQTREMSERVLNSKIAGTLILDELLKDEELDFFILCSSISSITAPLGQVAYCAANAFMDSFAYYKMLNHHTFTVSIDWDAWSEVGMAVEAVRKLTNESTFSPGVSHEQAVDYPLFNACRIINSDQVIYVSRLGVKNCWLLDEHRIQGKATLPGTGYLEMARAAVTHHTGNHFIELREFLSLAPIIVEEDEEKEVQVILERKGDEYVFSFISQVNPGEDKWLEHARGKALTLINHESRQISVKEIEDTCSEQEMVIKPEDFTSKKGAMTLGPRWNNLRAVKFGKKQALGFLELPGEFSADMDSYKLHPAILDVGNVLMRQEKNEDSPYVPVFYKRLSIKGDLPRKTLFHVKAAESNKFNAETLEYSIVIMDETGKELVNIEDYTLRKVKLDAVPADNTNVPFSESPALRDKQEAVHPYSFFVSSPALDDRDTSSLQEQELLKDAISPREGIDIFRRVLGSSGFPQAAVSTIDLLGRLERDWQLIRGRSGKEAGEREADRSPAKHARPELSTEYVAPDTEIERRLAPIWEDLLGIEQVGAYDDFFELGGDSLKAVNFSNRIHKELNTEVSISEFFNHPNIKELAQYIIEHSEISHFYSVKPVEKKEYYPLSPTQQRLFVLKQLEEANVAYNLSDTAVLEIDFNIEKMKRAFVKLIDRHEGLRTSFRLIYGEPVQKVHETVEFEIAYHELDKKTGRTKGKEEDIITDFVRPFDLSRPPLMRTGLIKSVDQKYILMVDFHHIIFDGISFPIFYKEILAFYREEELASLRIQYKEYVEWINRQENKEIEKRREAYWLEMYSQDIPVLQLPLDFERPVIQSFAGCTLDFAVESEATDALRQLAKDEEITLFMVLLAVLNVLLMKLSGQEDIVAGTSVAGRRHTDLAPIIGVFVNTLALRNYPAGNKSFRTFLKEVKATTLRAFENQEYPFEDLVDKTAVDRDLSRNPLFDVMFILNSQFQSIRRSKPKQQNPELSDYKYRKTASQFDISFNCFEVDDWLLFEVEYCTRLFKRESIERFMRFFNEIIAFVAEHPDEKLLDIEILSEQEKNQVLHEFNNTGIEYPRDSTLHLLFQEQVERTPHRVVVVGSSHPAADKERRRGELEQLTYRELNRQSKRLGHLLKEKGVEVGTIVGVMVERRSRMMVGLLGILKTGGVYLPLDPEYPSRRIAYILGNSSADLLLTSRSLSKEVEKLRGLEIETVFIEEVEKLRSLEKDTPGRVYKEPAACNLQPATTSSNLCYVIYTSGSTGNPKGVAVKHQNVVNFIKGMTDKIDFSPGKSILALTTVSFDIFLLETLLPVTCGLTVVIANEEEQTDPNLLANVILNRQVEMIQATPSRLQLLLSLQDDLWCLRYVKELMVGGEAFPAHLFNSVKSNFSGRIYNLYGPTETTVWSTVKDLTHSQPDDITIGNPITNTRVYILNGDNRLQPVGVPGVLLIGGDGVAAGYLDNYHLTAERFIPDPFAGSERRLYRTGDLARWLLDGELEFLGRIDHQVKVRGFRIELEEIEEQLVNHQDIKEAVVVSKINKNNDKYLVAYIVPASANEGKDLELKALNEYLAQQLPHYMIPSYFVSLEEIPLTPNGKINRRALPEPEESRLKPSVAYIEPTNEVEKIIATIWEEELGLEEIGINNNFFSLGGNSLDILKVNYRLKEAFARDIPVVAQFRYRTIGAFARYLSREADELSTRDRSEALKRGEKNKLKRLQVRREKSQ